MNEVWKWVILLVFLVAACGEVKDTDVPSQDSSYTAVFHDVFTRVFRVTDKEAGVVCWLVTRSHGAGIDCLPIEQTKIKQP